MKTRILFLAGMFAVLNSLTSCVDREDDTDATSFPSVESTSSVENDKETENDLDHGDQGDDMPGDD